MCASSVGTVLGTSWQYAGLLHACVRTSSLCLQLLLLLLSLAQPPRRILPCRFDAVELVQVRLQLLTQPALLALELSRGPLLRIKR